MRAVFLSLSLSMLLLVPAFSRADCPVRKEVPDRLLVIERAILEAQSCHEAHHMAEDCALESASDLVITDAAIQVCARDYIKISKSDKEILETLMKKCKDKYADKADTAHLSFVGFCRLDQAQALSSIYKAVED